MTAILPNRPPAFAAAGQTIVPSGLSALISEGGGFRGVFSAGVMNQLHKAGLNFDILCGSSAGSGNLAYWADGAYDRFEQGWLSHLRTKQFINFWNVFRGRPIMDLDYLVKEFYVNEYPLNVERINAASLRFFITITDCEKGEAHYVENKPGTDILGALGVGSAMPGASELPRNYMDIPGADGGITDSIPVQKAIEEGAKELWIILTQPLGYRKPSASKIPWQSIWFRKYPELAKAMRRRNEMYNDQLATVERLEREGRAHVFRPPQDLNLSRFTTDESKLNQAVVVAMALTRSYLETLGLESR